MWPRPTPRDPESPEFLFFVILALVGLLIFYAFGAYRVSKGQRPYYEMLAREVCDPGTGQARFIWFPPQYSFRGRYQGHPIRFAAATAGRQMRTHLFLNVPVHHDLKINRHTLPGTPAGIQQA